MCHIDNFIAKLHAGETVLNRANATAYRAGIVGGIDYARLGQITVEAVSNALAGMAVTMSGEQVGRLPKEQGLCAMRISE